MPMPRLAGGDHRPLQNVKRGEQGGRSVPLIIVRLSCGEAGPQRKNQLRALQGLNLAFLIHAEDDRLIQWVHIEPTMSRTFRANSGSLLTLKDSTRWGGSLCFFQMRCTVAGLT